MEKDSLKSVSGLIKIIGLILLIYVVGISIYAIFQYSSNKYKLLTYGVTDATATLIATFIMLIALGLPVFSIFRIFIHRGRLLDYGMALILPLISWGIAQIPANFDARTGKVLKYYSIRPDGSLFYLDRPGIDPLTQKQLVPMNQHLAELQFRKDRGLIPKRITSSTSDIIFFDPLTAEPRVWFSKNDEGYYDLYDNPGANPQTGEQLQPVTKDVVVLIKQSVKRNELLDERKRQVDMLREDAFTHPVSSQQPRSANSSWLFPDSNVKLLTNYELQSLSAEELWIARNEIFARHGYIFKTERGRKYTRSLESNYVGTEPDADIVAKKFNRFENSNIEMIKKYENR